MRATATDYLEKFPNVKLRGFERNRQRLLEGIENGLLDIAVMIGETRYPNIRTRPFWSERILGSGPINWLAGGAIG
ncbi:LysR substrate-binding domain-containing protein [uncultured Sphingobium sp.]|uniref:LysR substrate-binding domain-containing protein n=1 Tax=uncultured Sphingobium sp. TaxID=316087 RepID=UPI00260425E2|nr:LysR substrate-binding domain-containing protein [uncultured Sphingobium sp.]